MKRFIEYLSKNNIISIIATGFFCSIIYILRENIEFRPETVTYINLGTICTLLWMAYKAVRKNYTRWRYIISILLTSFVFNRFYYKEIFWNTFHSKLVNFVIATSIIVLLIVVYPLIKRFFVWSWAKISLLFERWVERRETEEDQYKKDIIERSLKREKKKNLKPEQEEPEGVFPELDHEIDGKQQDKKIPTPAAAGNSGGKNRAANIISVIAFIAVLAVLVGISFWSPSQISDTMKEVKSSNWMNAILSRAAVFILLVFAAGIIVSLIIKWGQIIIGIATNQQKREMYFVFACCLFLTSQHIFTNYSFTTDDLANLLLDGKLFTFPLVLSILIPIFIIFAENIIAFTTKNKKIKKALKECGKQTIRIAKGIIKSLLDFIELVTKDFLSMVLEIAKEEDD